MKKREFIVDITIVLPKGKSHDEWSFVDHLYLDFKEGESGAEMGVKIQESVSDWLKKHPSVHDCYENSIETEAGYFCSACGKNTTTEVENLVKLSRERRIHDRATDIVT